jgi:DNA-binding transcriptional regulator YiaG
MHKLNIELERLPRLPLSRRKDLPAVSAVYIAVGPNDIIEYIGQAVDLRRRWRRHECSFELESPRNTVIYWLETPWENLTLIENHLIETLRPRINKVRHRRIKPNADRKAYAIRGAKTALTEYDSIAFDLKQWRESHNLSQRELAKYMGVARNTVTRWEIGDRSMPIMLNRVLLQLEQSFKTKN